MTKTIVSGLVTVLLLAACDGRQGPEGPVGPPGEEFVGQTFEFDNVSFDYDSELNYWIYTIEIPQSVVVYDSDAILAYRFVESVPDGDGGEADAWELLPSVYFFDGGHLIQYVPNHTYFDVQLIIDGTYDLRDLDPGFTDDQLFRFVVVPSAFVTEGGVDVADYEAVVNALGIADHYEL